ncbi:acetate kinase [Halodesulfurarchaeum sp. HSR-GB]|uniref:acetate/propionate family kinase n=1 Tax=Halodesulfurarchaeum sp. HSR-GB TaxID=3074077 RepID=UPI002863B46D|nr:acetate kinase [Halodesulfurarchaeum sp. HSR-GB]MDR5657591.1 acetate kinase [Halodesulfurarchaeum sp. HSR-GB]
MILVINCGSTSIKYELFEDLESVTEGEVGDIGGENAYVSQRVGAETVTSEQPIADHREGMGVVLNCLTDSEHGLLDGTGVIEAVGHRVVHGGERTEPVLVDESVKRTIRKFASVAPLHNPVNLAGIEAMADRLPETPQVAVFDTAFHQTMPPEAYLYGLPYRFYDDHDIRRYGFHGISHAYVAREACDILDRPVGETNLITCHLGGGCSVAAVAGGRSVDTSMGFSPLEGIVMATRSGDVDPTVVKHLYEELDMDLERIFEILNDESGLAGLSGISGDMRELLKARENGDERADLAIRTFAYSVKQRIGAYAATLGEVDGIVFTAGIGENASLVRELAGNIELLDANVDPKRNTSLNGDAGIVSTDDSETAVLVVPTDEERRIARKTAALVK